VDRRVAQGRSPLASDAPSSLFVSIAIGSALVALALVVYTLSHPYRFYNHFEWQALAFLEGQTAIRFPVAATATSPGNAFFNDVLPIATTDGVERGVVPFPPLPAIVLMPFVALWGVAADGQLVFAMIGAIDVGIAWWVLGRLPIRTWVRFAATIFFGFGTVLWYAAQLGTTWYQAHVLAVGLALAAIGVALGADRDAARSEDDIADEVDLERRLELQGGLAAPNGAGRAGAIAVRGPRFRVADLVPEPRQFLAGLLFGLACTSRLTIVFAAPFFLLVGAGGSWKRRGWSAALGAGIPIGLLVVYNVVSTGHIFHPGYQYLYELEAGFYKALNYNLDWQIEDLRYLPQNVGIMFFNTPVWNPMVVPSALGLGGPLCTEPDAVRGLFNPACPIVLPKDTGMSILLTSPAYLFVLPALRWGFGISRLVTGAGIAIVIVAVINLMHFSQGWVQFGYRFSLDFAPWAILLVAIGIERIAAWARPADARRRLAGADTVPAWPEEGAVRRWRSANRDRARASTDARTLGGGTVDDGAGGAATGGRRVLGWLAIGLVIVLVAASVFVNLWGVVWGDVLGW
jgi:hypothetical protein